MASFRADFSPRFLSFFVKRKFIKTSWHAQLLHWSGLWSYMQFQLQILLNNKLKSIDIEDQCWDFLKKQTFIFPSTSFGFSTCWLLKMCCWAVTFPYNLLDNMLVLMYYCLFFSLTCKDKEDSVVMATEFYFSSPFLLN